MTLLSMQQTTVEFTQTQWLPLHSSSSLPDPPLKRQHCLPVFLRHVFDELHLIQDDMSPPSPQEMALVFHQQLVGRHAHMEAVGFSPPLRMNESVMLANATVATLEASGSIKTLDESEDTTRKKKKEKKID